MRRERKGEFKEGGGIGEEGRKIIVELGMKG